MFHNDLHFQKFQEFSKLSEILVIVLEQFSFDKQTSQWEKVSGHMDCPFHLNMEPYVKTTQVGETTSCVYLLLSFIKVSPHNIVSYLLCLLFIIL